MESTKKDKELQLFLFLDEIFNKNKDLSKEYHTMQISLYLKYNK